MGRAYSQKEIDSFQAVEIELRSAGLIVDNEIGESNATIVQQYFETHPEDITKESIKAVVFGPLKDSLVWKTETEREFEVVWATLSSVERGNFNSWNRPARLLNSLENNLKVLRYLKVSQRYTVDSRTLDLAAGQRIAPQLDWDLAPQAINPRQHTDDGTGFLQDKKSEKYRSDGRINHSYVEPGKEAPKTGTQDQDAWQVMCKNLLQQGTHSQQASFKAIYDHAVAQGKSWREVYSAMNKLKQSQERVTPRGI